jgi:hypothetical protein
MGGLPCHSPAWDHAQRIVSLTQRDQAIRRVTALATRDKRRATPAWTVCGDELVGRALTGTYDRSNQLHAAAIQWFEVSGGRRSCAVGGKHYYEPGR